MALLQWSCQSNAKQLCVARSRICNAPSNMCRTRKLIMNNIETGFVVDRYRIFGTFNTICGTENTSITDSKTNLLIERGRVFNVSSSMYGISMNIGDCDWGSTFPGEENFPAKIEENAWDTKIEENAWDIIGSFSRIDRFLVFMYTLRIPYIYFMYSVFFLRIDLVW